MNEVVKIVLGIVISGLIVFLVALLKFLFEYFGWETDGQKKKSYMESFNNVVEMLASGNLAQQLSAAVLLRRFFDIKWHNDTYFFKKETINLISGILRTLSVGVYQKTLADSLAYSKDLSYVDLQKCNLQNAFLGVKRIDDAKLNVLENDLILYKTDFFMSDLSYALIDHVNGDYAIFYHAILCSASIKNSSFRNANFSNADLRNVSFENVNLYGANFSNAKNLPEFLLKNLDEKGNCILDENVTIKQGNVYKEIFFSLPGCLSKEDDILAKAYKEMLENKGYKVNYYSRDIYPRFGQLGQVRQNILNASAMVIFGFKQLNIERAVYRPNTIEEQEWHDKWLPMPWNEIEMGMGLMRGLPILIVKAPELDLGSYDTELSEYSVSVVLTTDKLSEIETKNENFRIWCSLF